MGSRSRREEYWNDAFFREHIVDWNLLAGNVGNIFDYTYRNQENGSYAKTLYLNKGTFAMAYRILDIHGNEIPVILKVYTEPFVERVEIKETILSWHHEKHPLSQYFLPYVFITDGCTDFSASPQKAPMVLMQRGGSTGSSTSLLDSSFLIEADPQTIKEIADAFLLMIRHLDAAGVGFGDLAGDNIIVTKDDNGNIALQLVDYDDLYVPGMKKEKSLQCGKKGYQHKTRISGKPFVLDEKIHYFSSIVIYLSLELLARDKETFGNYLDKDVKYLIFSPEELKNPTKEGGIFCDICKNQNISDEIKNLAKTLFNYANADSVEQFKSLSTLLNCAPLPLPQPKTYLVKYYGSGGKINGKSSYHETRYSGEKWVLPVPSRKNYKFMGWSYRKNGDIAHLDGEEVCNLSDEKGDSIFLYAIWEKFTYTVICHENGERDSTIVNTYFFDETWILKNQFAHKGHSFIGWSHMPTEKPVYFNGTEFGSKSTPIWSGENEEQIHLYAQWKPITYNVIYHCLDDNVTGSMPPTKHTYGYTQKLRKNTFVHKSDYIFLGWGTDTKKIYSDEEEVTNLALEDGDNVHLYSLWFPKYHHIAYYADGDANSKQSESIHPYKSVIKLDRNPFKKEGYLFKGWTKRPGEPEEYKDQALLPINIVEHVVNPRTYLYAVWEKIPNTTYEVIYIKDANSNESVNSTHIIGEKQKLKANAFVRDGYVFDGWMDVNGKKYTDQQEVLNLTDKDGGKVYLGATWKLKEEQVDKNKKNDTQTPSLVKKNPPTKEAPRKEDTTYTLIYHGNGAKQKIDYESSNLSLNKEYQLMENPYSRDGYSFTGWSWKFGDNLLEDKSTLTIEDIHILPEDREIHLYAQWDKTESPIPPFILGLVFAAITFSSGIAMLMLPHIQEWSYISLSVAGIISIICACLCMHKIGEINDTTVVTTLLSIIIFVGMTLSTLIGILVFAQALWSMVSISIVISAILLAVFLIGTVSIYAE